MRMLLNVSVLALTLAGLLSASPAAAQEKVEVRRGGPVLVGEREIVRRTFLVGERPYLAVDSLDNFFEGEWDARPAEDGKGIIIRTGRETAEATRGIIILTGRPVSERGIIILTGREREEAWMPLADLAKGMGTEVRATREGYRLEPTGCDDCPIRLREDLRTRER